MNICKLLLLSIIVVVVWLDTTSWSHAQEAGETLNQETGTGEEELPRTRNFPEDFFPVGVPGMWGEFNFEVFARGKALPRLKTPAAFVHDPSSSITQGTKSHYSNGTMFITKKDVARNGAARGDDLFVGDDEFHTQYVLCGDDFGEEIEMFLGGRTNSLSVVDSAKDTFLQTHKGFYRLGADREIPPLTCDSGHKNADGVVLVSVISGNRIAEDMSAVGANMEAHSASWYFLGKKKQSSEQKHATSLVGNDKAQKRELAATDYRVKNVLDHSATTNGYELEKVVIFSRVGEVPVSFLQANLRLFIVAGGFILFRLYTGYRFTSNKVKMQKQILAMHKHY